MAATLHVAVIRVIGTDTSLTVFADCLRESANADGGWPYYRGNGSRLEPTAWAIFALGDATRTPAVVRNFFTTCQRDDGLLVDPSSPYTNFTSHALALLAMHTRAAAAKGSVTRHALAALIREKGIRIPLEYQYCQNNRLQGWSWCPDTFSWVEPTAWSMLALKKAARSVDMSLRDAARARVTEAERLLLNRACATGGWNYGNANMYGRELHAHVPTTAVALLAMQDQRDEPAVRRALEFLWTHRLSELTGMALALATICLRVFDRPVDDIEPQLIATLPVATRRGNIHVLAMAIYALTGSANDFEAIRL